MASLLVNDTPVGQYQVCYLRVVRLNANCTAVTGADAAAISAGLVTFTATPEIEEGSKFEAKSGCDSILWTAETCDKIKRWNLQGEFILFDVELMEIMFGGSVIVGDAGTAFAGKNIGHAMPGINSTCPNGVSLELWTKNSTGAGLCDVVGADVPLYTRHVFPRAIFTPGERVFENDIARLQFTGFSTENPNWDTGPYDDYPGVGDLDANTGYAQFVEDALPFDPDTAGGYLVV